MSILHYIWQSSIARRSRSDDVNAVSRLPFLNETYYRDILCEISGMFAIANKVDNIHKRPWIGFQSWRAAGRKVFVISLGFETFYRDHFVMLVSSVEQMVC